MLGYTANRSHYTTGVNGITQKYWRFILLEKEWMKHIAILYQDYYKDRRVEE